MLLFFGGGFGLGLISPPLLLCCSGKVKRMGAEEGLTSCTSLGFGFSAALLFSLQVAVI